MCNVVPIFRPEVVKGGVSPELQSALSQVIAEGRFIKGCEVAAFEKELCLELQTHSVRVPMLGKKQEKVLKDP